MRKDRQELQINRQLRRRPMLDQIRPHGLECSISSRVGFDFLIHSRNLDLFLGEFGRKGRYKLVPTHLPSLETPSEIPGLGIEKTDLVIRPGWTIGANDPDSCALDLSDPPVVPPNQVNPPVFKAMEQMASFRERREKAASGEAG
jgi:hypothetical protein